MDAGSSLFLHHPFSQVGARVSHLQANRLSSILYASTQTYYYITSIYNICTQVGARVSYLEAECRLKAQVADAEANRIETLFDNAIASSRVELATVSCCVTVTVFAQAYMQGQHLSSFPFCDHDLIPTACGKECVYVSHVCCAHARGFTGLSNEQLSSQFQ